MPNIQEWVVLGVSFVVALIPLLMRGRRRQAQKRRSKGVIVGRTLLVATLAIISSLVFEVGQPASAEELVPTPTQVVLRQAEFLRFQTISPCTTRMDNIIASQFDGVKDDALASLSIDSQYYNHCTNVTFVHAVGKTRFSEANGVTYDVTRGIISGRVPMEELISHATYTLQVDLVVTGVYKITSQDFLTKPSQLMPVTHRQETREGTGHCEGKVSLGTYNFIPTSGAVCSVYFERLTPVT